MKKVVIATLGLTVLALFTAGSVFAGPGCCASKAKTTVTQASAAACETKTEQASACVEKTIKLSIDGMNSSRSSKTVQTALTNLEGVCGAKVSYTRKNAQVTYNAACLSEENIVQAVNATGFTVVEVKTASSKLSKDGANDACCKAVKKSGT